MVKSLLHKRWYSWAFYVHLIAIKLILFIMLLYQESFEKPQVYFGFLFSTLLKYLALPKTNRKFKLLILEHFYGRGPFQLSIPPSHEHWKVSPYWEYLDFSQLLYQRDRKSEQNERKARGDRRWGLRAKRARRIQFSSGSLRAFNDGIEIPENRRLWI